MLSPTHFTTKLCKKYYCVKASLLPHLKTRWTLTLFFVLVYFYRCMGLQYYVITYLILFYMLQLLVSYFTPKGIQQYEQEQEEIENIEEPIFFEQDFVYTLHSFNQQKPLVSQLGEYQIWQRASLSFIIGICCTMFKQMEIDVFWPMLMLYFVGLISYTFYKVVKKMQKYRYSLSDFKKKPAEI